MNREEIFMMWILIVALVLGFGSHYVLKKDDNAIEEISEEVIKVETGIDVDLTPSSKETEDCTDCNNG